METRALGGARFVGPYNDIVAVRVCGEKPVNAFRMAAVLVDDAVHPEQGIQIEFTRFNSTFSVFGLQRLRLAVPHAAQFPCVEERCPVDELRQLTQRGALDRAGAGERWHWRLIVRPIVFRPCSAGIGE